jgi:hypothetical protein
MQRNACTALACVWRAFPWGWACHLARQLLFVYITIAVPNLPWYMGKHWASTFFFNLGPNEAFVTILNYPVRVGRPKVQDIFSLPVRRGKAIGDRL